MSNTRTSKRVVRKIESRKVIEEAAGVISKRRTAGYARVSTDSEEQLSSYEAQVDYYTKLIQNREDWIFVEVYTDEGITALNTKKRHGFNRMIADAIEGKMDLIITKSIARFARNTVDSLSTIRLLKEHNVEVYFEKENLYTFDSKGELLISIISSIAQDESRSISENVAWGWRKRFADGQFTLPYAQFLGYVKGANGLPSIVESEAAVVRRIYALFLQDNSACYIAKQLTADRVPTPSGMSTWRSSVVLSILTNEKYAGSALLQKTYTADYITKQKKRNEGELPQFYVEYSHPPIISKEAFQLTQERFEEYRSLSVRRGTSKHVLSGKLICGQCGERYGRKVHQSNTKYRRIGWRCAHRYDKDRPCPNRDVADQFVLDRYVAVVNRLFDQHQGVAQECLNIALDSVGKRRAPSATSDEADRKKQIAEVLSPSPPAVHTFEEGMWYALTHHVVVLGKKQLVFFGRDGSELPQP